MNKGRLYRIFLATVVVCLNPMLLAFSANANGDSAACPTVWKGYVDTARAVVESMSADADIVFVNRDGEAFDCLGVGLSEKELLRISRLESSLPIDRVVELSDRASTWPPNICSVGTGQLGPNYISISLPIEPRILGLEACFKSVSGGLGRALNKE